MKQYLNNPMKGDIVFHKDISPDLMDFLEHILTLDLSKLTQDLNPHSSNTWIFDWQLFKLLLLWSLSLSLLVELTCLIFLRTRTAWWGLMCGSGSGALWGTPTALRRPRPPDSSDSLQWGTKLRRRKFEAPPSSRWQRDLEKVTFKLR